MRIKISMTKTYRFFDRISCEANEKLQIKPKNWKEERKLNSETFGLINKTNTYTPRGQNYQYRNTNGRNYPRNGSGQQQQQYRQSNNTNNQMRYSNSNSNGQRLQSGQRTGGYQNNGGYQSNNGYQSNGGYQSTGGYQSNGYRRNDSYVAAGQRVGGRRFGSR